MIILYFSQFSSKWHALGCIKIRKKIAAQMIYIYTMTNKYRTCKEHTKTYLQLKMNTSVHYTQNKRPIQIIYTNMYDIKQI